MRTPNVPPPAHRWESTTRAQGLESQYLGYLVFKQQCASFEKSKGDAVTHLVGFERRGGRESQGFAVLDGVELMQKHFCEQSHTTH